MKHGLAAALAIAAVACGGEAPRVTAPVAPGTAQEPAPLAAAPTPAPARATDASPEGDAADIPAACDALLQKLAACLSASGNAPVAAPVLKTMRDAWRVQAQDPQQRAALADVCSEAAKRFPQMYPKCH